MEKKNEQAKAVPAKFDPVQGTLKLANPIKIDGKDITEVTYDSNEIDGVLFATAESVRKMSAGMKNTTISLSAEFDFGLHLYMGFAAIIAVNPGYDFKDVERIKGRDVVKVMSIGRNFMLASEKESQESGSDAPTETTPESTTQALETSKVNE